MPRPLVELFWDVGSTNTYFALKLLAPILARYDAELVLRPFNLGHVFRSNQYELMKEPRDKLRHRRVDLMRWAARYALPFKMPKEFPIKSSRTLRTSLVMRRHGLELPFVDRVMAAYWEQGDASIAEYAGLRPIVASLGADAAACEALSSSDEIGAELAASTDEGLARGVFGVPSMFVGAEMFWGKDRMDFVEEELRRVASQHR